MALFAARLFAARPAFSAVRCSVGCRLRCPARTTCSASQPKLLEIFGRSSRASSTSPRAATPIPAHHVDRPNMQANSAAAAVVDSAQTGVFPCDKTRAPKSQHRKIWRDQLADQHPALARKANAFIRSWEQYMARDEVAAATAWSSVLDKVFRRKPNIKVSTDDEVTFFEIKDYLKAGVRLKVLIDVREPGEYAEGHIPGAHNVPLADLTSGLAKVERIYLEEEKQVTAKTLQEELDSGTRPASPEQGGRELIDLLYADGECDPLRLPTFIFYCSNGVRAKVAQALALRSGYDHRALVYRPSYNEWVRFINHERDPESA